MPLLKVEKVDIYYGEVHVLNSVSFYILEKEIVALIGTNGAGKSTMINVISGINHLRRGQILFMGEAIHQNPPILL
jgi:ABC-type branched-subunit amino acid transport system ATPase component